MLIVQRTPTQCVIATIAMATGRPYDEVLAAALASNEFDEALGCKSEAKVLEHLGYSNRFEDGFPVGDFRWMLKAYQISAEFFRDQAWGRRAIMAVPSLNITGGSHSVYWDGYSVFDPNPTVRRRYTAWKELLPTEMIVFRERGVQHD